MVYLAKDSVLHFMVNSFSYSPATILITPVLHWSQVVPLWWTNSSKEIRRYLESRAYGPDVVLWFLLASSRPRCLRVPIGNIRMTERYNGPRSVIIIT